MRSAFTLLAAFLISQGVFAQNVTLKGSIKDTSENKILTNAVVSLIRKADSTLVHFTRSNKEGSFRFDSVQQGKYTLLITYPKFADLADDIELKDPEHNLGTLALTQKIKLLSEVIVRSAAAIRIKGDTTEFTADSFIVKEGATVEDLLKKLPGFQVNSKGEITTQGKRVEKVLVDGEEFFGDDPTMATQNLSAKIVDKVQVFDTKNEQQKLTGIATGNEGKTINIKLKDDKKKGYFGKLSAGTNFDNLVDAKALYNRFTGKKKVSLYGTRTDLNTGSLNWEDRQKLGIEEDYEYDEISGYYYSFGSNDEFSNNNQGLPRAYTAGALFSNKWRGDTNNVNLSYRYNRLNVFNDASVRMQNILPTTVNYRNRFTVSEGLNEQHAVNGKYEWKKDSLTSFKITTAGSYKTTSSSSVVNSEFLNNNKEQINISDQIRESQTKRVQSDNTFTYKQLFKKKNRQLLTTLRLGLTDDDNSGMNRTATRFYKNNLPDSLDLVDQMRLFDGASTTLGGKLTYNEPFGKKWNLVLEYGHNRNHAESNRGTFNKNPVGKYDDYDSSFSNKFNLNVYSHSTLTMMRFTDKKFRFNIGSGVSSIRLKLHDVNADTRNSYNFLNLTPQANMAYTLKQNGNVSLSYRGTTRQPTIDQLQPIRDNNDPLYEFQGNPELKVSFNNNVSLNFHQYKVLSGSYIGINGNYSTTSNAITNYNVLDTLTGKQTYRPVNVDGVRNFNLYFNRGFAKTPKGLRFGVNINGNISRNLGFVNGELGITNSMRSDFGVSVSYEKEEKANFYIAPHIGYNSTKSSFDNALNNNYFIYGAWANMFFMLPAKLELSAEMNMDIYGGIEAFGTSNNIINIKPSLARKVFKDKTGKIIFLVNDVLNQNTGFDRNITTNFISESRYSRLSRYFILRFEWTFTKMPGAK
jgi:hypothetical protein